MADRTLQALALPGIGLGFIDPGQDERRTRAMPGAADAHRSSALWEGDDFFQFGAGRGGHAAEQARVGDAGSEYPARR